MGVSNFFSVKYRENNIADCPRAVNGSGISSGYMQPMSAEPRTGAARRRAAKAAACAIIVK